MDDPTTTGVTEGFGLMFYNARWYDPYLNHFTQPDSIIPDPYNSQDWNRYSYVRNNPLRYTDSSGHMMDQGDGGCTNERDCKKNPTKKDLVQSIIETGNKSKNRENKTYFRQLAIEAVIDAYRLDLASPSINLSAYSGSADFLARTGINLGYNPDFAGTGQTFPGPGMGIDYGQNGLNIKIGEGAFSSAGWLASTIGHENIHLQQALDGHYYAGDAGGALNEIEAYDWELSHAVDNGLSPLEITRLKDLRQSKGQDIWNATMVGIAVPANYLYPFPAAPTPTAIP